MIFKKKRSKHPPTKVCVYSLSENRLYPNFKNSVAYFLKFVKGKEEKAMKDLMKATITTVEVAEMMEIEHKRLIRKLEGDKTRKGYIQILTEAQMGLSDYFIPSTYRDASGKENKCYEVTKLGCDFLANKSTGEKGVLFTARYVKRFYEMEHQVKELSPEQIPIGEIASYIKAMDRVFVRQQLAPHKIAEAFVMLSEQFGIHLPEGCVKLPEYEQMELPLDLRGGVA